MWLSMVTAGHFSFLPQTQSVASDLLLSCAAGYLHYEGNKRDAKRPRLIGNVFPRASNENSLVKKNVPLSYNGKRSKLQEHWLSVWYLTALMPDQRVQKPSPCTQQSLFNLLWNFLLFVPDRLTLGKSSEEPPNITTD